MSEARMCELVCEMARSMFDHGLTHRVTAFDIEWDA